MYGHAYKVLREQKQHDHSWKSRALCPPDKISDGSSLLRLSARHRQRQSISALQDDFLMGYRGVAYRQSIGIHSRIPGDY